MMFVLTDDAIESGIDTISGYVVNAAASRSGKPIEEIMEAFLSSETYMLLSDKETGYYWDSMEELIDMFLSELQDQVS
jgi:hypothetical protein